MNLKELAVVVLAAGKGTRFGESYTKLLHPVFGKPLIYYPIQNLLNLGISSIIAVISDPKVKEEIAKSFPCEFVYQKQLSGTASAVKLAMPKIPQSTKIVMVLNGDDATLYSKKTFEEFLKSHISHNSLISLMTLKTKRDTQAGRIIRDKKKNFSKILEYKEYLQSGVRSREINCGVYLFDREFLKSNLGNIEKSPNSEYYLTDLLNIAKEKSARVNLFVLKDHSQWIGINDKKDLKYAENVIKRRGLVVKEQKLKQTVHFLGIAGSGTSACAKLAEAEGFTVTGCDSNLFGEFADILEDIKTFKGHSPDHLDKVDILALTPAILSLDKDNPEILAANEKGIKILTWQQFLGKFLTAGKTVIAICGTHGKSTTTAMVGKLLEDAGFDPTVLLGATTSFWKSNFRVGLGKYFVVEADEFNDNYMSLNPNISILTNIDFDHPEYFKNFEDYQTSFQNFLHKTSVLIIANLEDKNSSQALQEKPGTQELFFPPLIDFSKNLIDFPLKVAGRHNILNASAAFNLALNLGIKPDVAKKSLENFPGVSRRMEYLSDLGGIQVFSDFAHHPTEIKAAIESLRQKHPGREIIVFYQPHMFSRTKALFDDFVKVFKNLDVSKVFILDIYPSREIDTGLVSSKELVNAINKESVQYITKDNIPNKLINQSANSLFIFMGAGDIDKLARELTNAE